MKIAKKILEKVSQTDLDRLESLLDKLFKSLNIDIEFTKHFLDRVNDPRNKEDITTPELADAFGALYKKYGKQIKSLPVDTQAVLKDIRSDINIPFVIDLNSETGMLELISKTVMRKKNFTTSNSVLKVGEMKLAERILNLLNEKLVIINKGKKSGQIVYLAGGAACYPNGTQFLTKSGWKNIEEYATGDHVLQYDLESGEASFVEPVEYYNIPASKMVNIKNKRIDFTTSIEHKHLVINEKTKNKEIKTTREILNQHNNTVRGNKCSFISTFDYNGQGIDISDEDIRVLIASYADGHYLDRRSNNICRLSFKKERKIERFKKILAESSYKQSREPYTDKYGFTRFEVIMHDGRREKEFENFWYSCSRRQLEVVIDEVIAWDGSICEKSGRLDAVTFSSNSRKSVDFIQFAFAACGYSSIIHDDTREGRNTNYALSVTQQSNTVGISKNNRTSNTTEIIEVDYEGNMYCFQVPTGFFIVRQNNRIIVSGNSGKGFSASKFLELRDYKKFDVDELKRMLIKIAKLKGDKELANLDLGRKEDVFKLHQYVKDKGLEDKLLDTFYSSIKQKSELPNIIFDITFKDTKNYYEKQEKIRDLGYKAEDTHLVWILADYEIAFQQNQERERKVPDDIVFQTHKGAATTMKNILSGNIPDGMDGEIYVVFSDKRLSVTKSSKTKFIGVDKKTGEKIPYVNITDFIYVKVKEVGKPIKSEEEIKKEVFSLAKQMVPKDIADLFS